jgi:potassium channel subfamily K
MVADATPDRAADAAIPFAQNILEKRSVWKRLRPQFRPRLMQDDKPRDWWFASTAIPLIAAATAPFANVMSIMALAISWRGTIHYDKIGNNGLPLQIPYDDPQWYAEDSRELCGC